MVEHSDEDVALAERRMALLLRQLDKPSKKAARTIDEISKLWVGYDGTKSMRGPRVLPEPESIMHVAGLVRDPRPHVRTMVFVALRAALPESIVAREALAIGLRDEVPLIRLQAARVLSEAPTVPDELVPLLREAVRDSLWSVRYCAVTALSGKLPEADYVEVVLASTPSGAAHATREWLTLAKTIPSAPPALLRGIAEVEQRLAAHGAT